MADLTQLSTNWWKHKHKKLLKHLNYSNNPAIDTTFCSSSSFLLKLKVIVFPFQKRMAKNKENWKP